MPSAPLASHPPGNIDKRTWGVQPPKGSLQARLVQTPREFDLVTMTYRAGRKDLKSAKQMLALHNNGNTLLSPMVLSEVVARVQAGGKINEARDTMRDSLASIEVLIATAPPAL